MMLPEEIECPECGAPVGVRCPGQSAHLQRGAAAYNAHTYQCLLPHCGNTFAHPATDDCLQRSENPDIEILGRCGHLLEAGWRPVWCRLYDDSSRGKLRFSFGGWLCAEHAQSSSSRKNT